MKTVISNLLAGGIATSGLSFSREELEAEAVVVDDQLAATDVAEPVAEATEAVETTEAELEASEQAIEETVEAGENLGEATQSLENLVELLSMESADLTQREYGMLMATANGYLEKAKISPEDMSFEEASEGDVSREEAKATLGEKIKALAKAGKDAVLKLLAEIGKWLAGMFDHVTRLRGQLVAMGKAASTQEIPDATVELDAKYGLVMAGRVVAGLGKAADRIFGEHTQSLRELGAEIAKQPLEEIAKGLRTQFRDIQFDGALPGNPHFGVEGQPAFSLAGEGSAHPNFAFNTDGKIVGEKPVQYKISTRVARTEIAEMIRLCDEITAAKKNWDAIDAENKKFYANDDFGARLVKRLGISGVAGLYNVGPRRFMKYAVQVLSLRAGGIAKAIKLAKAPASAASGSGTEVAVA